MQTLLNPFDWYAGDTLHWPMDDIKLQQVNDWIVDVDQAMSHVEHFGLAIQAGGACGIWPARLAGFFDEVITFEPVLDNYECLLANCERFDNIEANFGALGRKTSAVDMRRDDFEKGNAGAWYTVPGTDILQVAIDDMNLSRCDLIMLDVEGSELEALAGAVGTISKFKPVVVIENKQLPHMKELAKKAEEFVVSLGYHQVAKYHNDLVLVRN